MGLKRTTFEVHMVPADPAGEPVGYVVPIILSDQLRGELEGKRHGIDNTYPMHLSALWAWAAMLREGHYAGTFAEFKDACLDYNKVDTGESDDLDPTRPAASTGSA